MEEKIQLDKNYQPAEVESKWYDRWIKDNLFVASNTSSKPPYSIVMPPPNVTGSLHLGHALDNTLQDILIRAKRMMGFEVLWVPGTDHAGIATQKKVEDRIRKEGFSRYDLGRENFIKKVWEWKEEFGDAILNQFRRLGLSCDWTRERFTLDPMCSGAVREAFFRLYEKGLIYKGKRLINWCPRCLTALSDLEVEHKESASRLYYLKYMHADGSGAVVIATTRPETILADTAVCVNPGDERYKELIGSEVILPLSGRKLPVISDDVVDPAFGTGALKITPAHDPVDYEVGQRHGLESLEVIDEKGKMNENAGKYAGLDRFKCREAIVADLEEADLLEKTEEYRNSVGQCYRCDTVIEPHLSWQWFVKMKELAEPALKAEADGDVKFYPARHAQVFRYWLENIRDWCISRQLWWGHRIPVWSCEDCGHTAAFKEDPSACPQCGSPRFIQEEDVLDTWFSSGLWPLSTLGWPEETADLKFFYPTKVLVTARDIIFLWVARMIMMGLEFRGEVPFADVHIHATILGKDRRRMSKSLGTGVDPLELIDKYGTDATRFGLVYMTSQGQDIVYSEERIEMSRNFANKIWNAVRFCLNYFPEDMSAIGDPGDYGLSLADRWILGRLEQAAAKVTAAFDDYSFDVMAVSLYDFFWDDFCDWYIEIVKSGLSEGKDPAFRDRTVAVFHHVFKTFLRLLHPIMPFITEELWHVIPGLEGMAAAAAWPEPTRRFESEGREIARVFDTVRGIRSLRADVQLPPRKKVKIYIKSDDQSYCRLLRSQETILRDLAGAEEVILSSDAAEMPEKAISVMVGRNQIFLPALEIEDLAKQIARMEKDYEKALREAESAGKKLANPNFTGNARADVIEAEKARLETARLKADAISAQLSVLKSL